MSEWERVPLVLRLWEEQGENEGKENGKEKGGRVASYHSLSYWPTLTRFKLVRAYTVWLNNCKLNNNKSATSSLITSSCCHCGWALRRSTASHANTWIVQTTNSSALDWKSMHYIPVKTNGDPLLQCFSLVFYFLLSLSSSLSISNCWWAW